MLSGQVNKLSRYNNNDWFWLYSIVAKKYGQHELNILKRRVKTGYCHVILGVNLETITKKKNFFDCVQR